MRRQSLSGQRDLRPRIYPGPQRLGADASIIASTVLSYDTYSPQTAVVPVNGLDPCVEADGLYTIKVVTVTPSTTASPSASLGTGLCFDLHIMLQAPRFSPLSHFQKFKSGPEMHRSKIPHNKKGNLSAP